jgi:uncharacterized protein
VSRLLNKTIGIAALAAVFAVTACGSASDESQVEMPNPAAAFCEKQGGTAFGPEPMCGLPDGSTVDAWDYYRAGIEGDAIAPTTTPTTAAPTTVAPADPAASLEALTGPKASHSEVSEGPCGTFAVVVEGRSPDDGMWVGPVLYEWDDGKWVNAQLDPGPFPIDDREAENQPEPAGVTSGDFTGDGVIEFLVTYSAFSLYGGSYSFGSVLFPRAEVLGDTYYECVWGWSSFRADIFDPPYPQTLRYLEFEDGTLKEAADRAVTFDPIDEIFDLDNAIVSACQASNGRDAGCGSEFEPSLYVGCSEGYFPLEQCEGMEHPDDIRPDVGATCPTYEYTEYEPFSLCTNGPGVATLQRALVFFDYLNGGADGYFGPTTDRAVRQLQRDYGVPEDGVVAGWWYHDFIETYNLSR